MEEMKKMKDGEALEEALRISERLKEKTDDREQIHLILNIVAGLILGHLWRVRGD